jgi:hypothetical protein
MFRRLMLFNGKPYGKGTFWEGRHGWEDDCKKICHELE